MTYMGDLKYLCDQGRNDARADEQSQTPNTPDNAVNTAVNFRDFI